jgi:hypothetical protein
VSTAAPMLADGLQLFCAESRAKHCSVVSGCGVLAHLAGCWVVHPAEALLCSSCGRWHIRRCPCRCNSHLCAPVSPCNTILPGDWWLLRALHC